MEHWVEICIAFITGILGPILIIYTKNYLDKKNKPDMVEEALPIVTGKQISTQCSICSFT